MIGKKIKRLREKNSMTVEFVANQLDIPVQKIIQFEQCNMFPTRRELIKFADLFEVETDSFFFENLKKVELFRCF